MKRLAVILILLSGCAPDITETDFYSRHPDEPIGGDELVTIASGSIAGYDMKVLAESELHVGPNTLLIELAREGQPVVSGDIHARGLWITETRELESPFGEGSATVANDDDQFEVLIHLLEPVGEDGHWQLELDADLGSASETTRSDVTVEPDIWVQYVEATETTEGYYLSWIQPARPSTGEDALELSMHRLTGQGFEAITGATFDLYPYMDMGSGDGHSTPFEAPVHSGAGLYRGSVNFIMAGGWDMTVFVNRDGHEDTVVFKGFTVY